MKRFLVSNHEKEHSVKKHDGHDESETSEGKGRGRKRAWASPELVEYGNIVKLTEGGTKSESPDHGANMMRI